MAYAGIKEKPVEWLWPGYIPLGALTLVDGMPEAGKTFLLVSIAAIISKGGTLPLDAGQSEPGSVLILSNEDDPERVTKRRLRVMGANQRRVYQVSEERPIDLAEDWAWLDEVIEHTPNVRMLIIDPLNAYLPKSNAYRKVASALHAIIVLAAKHQIAVVGVRHVVKGLKKGHPITWGVGSVAYAGRARMILAVAAHPFEENKRVLAPVKCSWGPRPHSLVFTISELGDGDATVEWLEEAVNLPAEALMVKTATNKPPPQLGACVEWLETVLKPGKSMETTKLEALAEKCHYSATTLKRARASLGWGAQKNGRAWQVVRPPKEGGQEVE